MLVVWGRKNSINVQKVMWTIGELGLAHERKDVGGPFGGLDTAEYGALNPNRRIPTIVDEDGTTVWESHSCVRYIAARYGAGSLWPEDPSARALGDLWLDWMQTTLLPDLAPVFLGLIRTPAEERDMAKIERCIRAMGETWRILDAHMEGRRFVAAIRSHHGRHRGRRRLLPLPCAGHRAPGAPQHRGLVRAPAGARALPHPRDDPAELAGTGHVRWGGHCLVRQGVAGSIRRRHANGRRQAVDRAGRSVFVSGYRTRSSRAVEGQAL